MAGKHKRVHRADDKRRSGLSDNVKWKADQGSTGAAKPLAIFNDRRDGKNGNGKRAR
ncbi:hypothetical protein [Streptomyces sp. NPDC058252]|uniref:hypothetical protein n=1 Tax=Streptomyces sp. NPDC058252 TaxID=3346405 RepID=UPI0036F02BB1